MFISSLGGVTRFPQKLTKRDLGHQVKLLYNDDTVSSSDNVLSFEMSVANIISITLSVFADRMFPICFQVLAIWSIALCLHVVFPGESRNLLDSMVVSMVPYCYI